MTLLRMIPLLLLLPLAAQDPDTFDRLHERGIEAYRQKDYKELLNCMERARALKPHHVRTLFNLSFAYLLVGDADRAVIEMNRLAQRGLVYEIETHPVFSKLRDGAGYAALAERFAQNRLPINHSLTAFVLPQKDFFPEGITWDSERKLFLVGSIHQRLILSIDAQGNTRRFIQPAQDGIWSVLGLAAHGPSRRLWACSTAFPQTKDIQPGEKGRAGLFLYHLDTGRLLKKWLLSNEDGEQNLGDLTLDGKGQAFVSDGRTGTVYRVDAEADQLETFWRGTPLVSPQGLALSADETRLYVADYRNGLFYIDTKHRTIHPLGAPPELVLEGIDGLAAVPGNGLIAIQNGITPHRVVRWQLNGEGTLIEKADILEMNNPLFDEPTLGVPVDGSFYYVANSQWGKYTEDHLPLPEDQLETIRILKLKL